MQKIRKIKNVIFLGRKPGAVLALNYLLKKGIKVKLIIAPDHEDYNLSLRDAAKKNSIPLFSDDRKLYDLIGQKDSLVKDIDLVVSFLYWRKIKRPLIDLGRLGCVNFHPAPLPDYKGRAGYNTAILDKKKNFGVSAHFIDSEKLDDGPIIEVERFPIDYLTENSYSLGVKSQVKLVELFKKTIDKLQGINKLNLLKNKGGLYLNKEQLENLKQVDIKRDNLEKINRKIRAFFFPPYQGAKIKIHNQEFTIINQEILNYMHKLIKDYEL